MDKHEKLIEAAVNYWANFFKSPAYGDKENGGQLGDSESTLMTFVKTSVNSSTNVTEEKISVFKQALTKHLQEKAERELDCTLQTDWAPEYPLSDFLFKAALPNTFFPSKRMMWVSFKKGTVKLEGEQIYPSVEKGKAA